MGGAAAEAVPRGQIEALLAQGGGCAAPTDEEKKPNQAKQNEEAEDQQKHCLSIVQGAAVSAAAYGAVLAATGSTQATEDIVDLAHSAYTSSVAVRGMAALEAHPRHLVALPAAAAAGNGRVVRMFCHSIGYFFADVVLIFTALGVFGQKPNLWQGRLAHHFIQAFAVLPCIFRSKSKEESLALRSVLCVAYFAEFSNIFLRLSNMLRSTKFTRAQNATNVALLASFAASRMLNFPLAIYIFARARTLISPSLFRLIGSIQASGYMLNLVWFVKIFKILLKPTKLPSIEC